MKTIASILALSLCAAAACSAKSLTPYEEEMLRAGKNLYDKRGQQEWLVGLKNRPADETAFKRSTQGVWYTGRVQVRRWGAGMSEPLEQYGWDTSKGQRWMVMREIVYRNPQTKIVGVAYQGPNALDQYKYGKVRTFSQDLLGRGKSNSASDGQKLTLKRRIGEGSAEKIASR